MKRSRILIGLFAVFVLSFGLLAAGPGIQKAQAADMPLTASATADASLQTQAVTKYAIWIGGKQVTSANLNDVIGNGSVKYDPSKATITLNNAKIKGAYREFSSNGAEYRSAIRVKTMTNITIVLKGKNTVVATGRASAGSYGICAPDTNVLIKGSGSLDARAGKAGLYSNGILCNNLNLLGSGKVTLRGGTMIKTSFKAGSAAGSIGIYSNGFLALGGSAKLVAIGKTRAFYKTPTFGQGYTPQVKAGNSSKSIKVNKKNPASSVYKKYKYVSITKAKATSKKPAKMTITKIAAFGGGFNVKWKTLSKNCTGYQFQFWKSGSSNKYTYLAPYTNNGDKVDGGSISDLAGGATYYMRVRGVNQVGSKTYYGAWSDTKSVTTLSGTPVG